MATGTGVEHPTYIVEAAGKRLRIAAYCIAASFALYMVLYSTIWVERSFCLAQVLSIATIALSLAVAYGVRSLSARSLIAASLLYEFIVCLSIEVMNGFTVDLSEPVELISWSCAVILVFPTFVVAAPKVQLLGSLFAASSAPVGYAITRWALDAPVGSGDGIFSAWLPPYLCALLSYIPAKVIHQLGADVGRARRLGSYELVEKLGSGGMGEVWIGRHELLARPAAIKLIRPGADIEGARARFEREAQVTASLESPNTVRLYDFGISDDGVFYYVMELLRGVDLETLVEQTGPLPPERVAHLLLQIGQSLQEAHEQQLVHRDIKPANLFVTRQANNYDVAKVLDFGLVKPAQSSSNDASATAENKILGTPAYLSPEMAQGNQELDGRTDLYALGCVAYYLLTGKPVFTGKTPMDVVIAHVTKPPEPLSSHTQGAIPPELEALIMQCLEKDIAKRPPSTADFVVALERLQLAAQWSNQKARQWWSEHLPEAFSGRWSTQPLSTSRTGWLEPRWSKR